MAQFVKKDPQNPYRTGVLIGNYCEDKFGATLAEKEVSTRTPMVSHSSITLDELQPCSPTLSLILHVTDFIYSNYFIDSKTEWNYRELSQVSRRKLFICL